MKRQFDFATFCNLLQEKGKLEIEDNLSKNYIYLLIQNDFSIKDIDFNKFNFEDLISVNDELDGLLTDENDQGDIFIDPNHPFTKMWSTQLIHVKMGELPKKRAKSPFLFL